MPSDLLMIIVTAAISCLITMVASMIYYPGKFQKMIDGAFQTHEEIWHKDSMYAYVEKVVEKHENNCTANQKIEKVERAVTFLYIKAGGNIKDLDFND